MMMTLIVSEESLARGGHIDMVSCMLLTFSKVFMTETKKQPTGEHEMSEVLEKRDRI